jgi:hypothetical protein
MNFRTTWQITPFENQLQHGDKIVLMGSCFSENIGAKLRYFGFDALVNPFGTIFHPLPLAQLINPLEELEIRPLERDGTWYAFESHSDLRGECELLLRENFSKQRELLQVYLKEAKMLVITFGSAWGYYKENQIVANCHKLPASLFEKRLTDLPEMIEIWQNLLIDLKKAYPNLQVVFTVSPVRHTKDGIVANQRSKSRLNELVHALNAGYFPSYEIQMDDLRDYRFYEADLIHPNAVAVDYIFEKFAEVAIAEEARKRFASIHKFRMFEAHQIKPWDEIRAATHAAEVVSRRAELIDKYPNLKL